MIRTISNYYKNGFEKFLKENLSNSNTDGLLENLLLEGKKSLFPQIMNQIRNRMEENWGPLYEAVVHMPLKDLCDLAYGFVNIQSFRSRFELNENSNSTVGGPIDLALITKEKGFKWVKSKNDTEV